MANLVGASGVSRGTTTSPYMPNQQAQQTLAAQQNASQAASRALQQQQYADQEQERQRIAADRASQTQLQLMQDNNNPRTTNGLQMEISNGGSVGGGSSRSGGGGGVAIGGSIYPDMSAMKAQLDSLYPAVQPPQRIGAPQVPQGESGFAHAKDVAGRSGQKALEALRNQMTARGISDSGMATMGEANILGNVARQGSDAEYEHQALNTSRQWDANQRAYQGDIGQNEMEYAGAQRQQAQSLQALMQLMNRLY